MVPERPVLAGLACGVRRRVSVMPLLIWQSKLDIWNIFGNLRLNDGMGLRD